MKARLTSDRVTVRLDNDQRAALDAYCETHGVTVAAAIRLLIAGGIAPAGIASHVTYGAAVREGLKVGTRLLRQRLATFVHETLEELDVGSTTAPARLRAVAEAPPSEPFIETDDDSDAMGIDLEQDDG